MESLQHSLKALLASADKHAVVFGSARDVLPSNFYKLAHDTGKYLSLKGYSIRTGGGLGIMKSVHEGALEADNSANIGIPCRGLGDPLPTSVIPNQIFAPNLAVRKRLLMQQATLFVVFPGGVGTISEFFELLAHFDCERNLIEPEFQEMQTIVLVGRTYWEPMLRFIEHSLLQTYQTVSPECFQRVHIANDLEDILDFA
jgi:uncharacterized protein (TIGR00730 family)